MTTGSLSTVATFKALNSTTPRTMANRLNDYVNVKDYGAVGDGAFDNRAAFLAALTAATLVIGANSRTGGIYVPRGWYKILPGTNVPLPPGTSYGAGGVDDYSFHLLGEGAEVTIISGDYNGFLLDGADGSDVLNGNYIIERIQVININTTPGSGCIRLANSQGIHVRNCNGSGEVWLSMENFTHAPQPAVGRMAQCGGTVEACTLTGGPGGTSVAIVAAGDFFEVRGCLIDHWGYGVVAHGRSITITGNHFEVNGTAIQCGLTTTGANAGFGAGAILANTFEACGTCIDLAQGCQAILIAGNGGLCHSDAGLDTPDNAAQYGLRIRDEAANKCTFLDNGFSGSVEEALISVGTINGRYMNLFKGMTALATDTSVEWLLSGSATGGSPVAGAANIGTFLQNDITPIWKFGDLPVYAITNGLIDGTVLSYGSISPSIEPIIGALITGVGVTAGTRIDDIGTTLLNATIDDGAGAAGIKLNFTGYSEVPPVVGGNLGGSNSQIATWNGKVDSGVGGVPGHVFTITPCTISTADISNGAGGSGTILTVTGTISNNDPINGIVGLLVTGAGISANTHVVAGSGSSYTLNKSYNLTGVALTLYPDLRPGYTLLEHGNINASWQINSARSGSAWQLTGASDENVPSAGSLLWYSALSGSTVLVTENTATNWDVDDFCNLGMSHPISNYMVLYNTFSVNNDHSPAVGPIAMKLYNSLTGDEFIINDSGTAASGNFAANVIVGGFGNTVTLRMDGVTGFIIVG